MRKLLFALLISATTALSAQSVPMDGFAHVAIRVKDVPAARAFYEKIGYIQAFTLENKGVLDRSFMKINDDQFIELYPVTEKQPEVGFLHLCFYGSDLDSLHKQYVKDELKPNELRKAGAGNLLFTMEGPEKQNIEYTQYMPGSLHSNDHGKHLGTPVSGKLVSVSLAMKDVPAARAFYTEKLRFPVTKTQSFAIPGTSGETVMIEDDQIGARMHVAFQVKSLKQAAASLKKRGVAFKSAKGSLSTTDPDGNIVEFRERAM
ncbi:VOC family protein [Terriglobus tenax]|uniref:VOC family protein n=1 Tax=Terriglobus tenax TaxID=1111115 RepID=UPI0021DFA460|nr:VOC family protein [Terriglobus tenax]